MNITIYCIAWYFPSVGWFRRCRKLSHLFRLSTMFPRKFRETNWFASSYRWTFITARFYGLFVRIELFDSSPFQTYQFSSVQAIAIVNANDILFFDHSGQDEYCCPFALENNTSVWSRSNTLALCSSVWLDRTMVTRTNGSTTYENKDARLFLDEKKTIHDGFLLATVHKEHIRSLY